MKGSPGLWPVWGAACREIGRATARRLRGLARLPRLRVPTPDRLVIAPYDLRTSDPTVAAEIADGAFRPDAVFAAAPAGDVATSPERALALYGFGWLRHLRAADTPEARIAARALAAAMIAERRRELDRGAGRDTPIVARRLLSFLGHSPVVLTGADHGFYIAYLRAIGRDAAALERDMTRSARPIDRLLAAIGVCSAALCCTGLERQLRRGNRVLSAELDRQIGPDGGHVGRNPGLLVELLLDLLPLKALYVGRGLAVPPALEGALARSLPALRRLRHGNGDLALFNGMGRTPASDLATLLAQDVGRPPASDEAPSGYGRVEAGDAVLLAEFGPVPPVPVSSDAHAGCLSFELSSGLDRIVVNCGAPGRGSPYRALARSTAAHSTLTLADTSSAHALEPSGVLGRFLQRRLGPVLLTGPTLVQTARRTGRSGSERISGQHDGYRRAFGAVHARRLELSGAGDALRGSDTLSFEGRRVLTLPAAIRFHLHPDVVANPDGDGRGVELRLPGGGRWLFTQEGGRLRIEDGAFFAVPEAWRPTAQIAVELAVEPGSAVASCRWRFERLPAEPDVPEDGLDEPVPAEAALPGSADMVSAPASSDERPDDPDAP